MALMVTNHPADLYWAGLSLAIGRPVKLFAEPPSSAVGLYHSP